MTSTRCSCHIAAPPERVFKALLDPQAVAVWRVPLGMRSEVHEFDGREGGSFRVSLTCDMPGALGKTSEHSDTHRGRFVRIVPNRQAIEVIEFETIVPEFAGEMTITMCSRGWRAAPRSSSSTMAYRWACPRSTT
jgi:uncharacterized protein YndB with AHSA1/START domain